MAQRSRRRSRIRYVVAGARCHRCLRRRNERRKSAEGPYRQCVRGQPSGIGQGRRMGLRHRGQRRVGRQERQLPRQRVARLPEHARNNSEDQVRRDHGDRTSPRLMARGRVGRLPRGGARPLGRCARTRSIGMSGRLPARRSAFGSCRLYEAPHIGRFARGLWDERAVPQLTPARRARARARPDGLSRSVRTSTRPAHRDASSPGRRRRRPRHGAAQG